MPKRGDMPDRQNGHKTFLSRDAIRGLSDVKSEEVCIPEWDNAYVMVRGMTGAERDAFEQSNIVGKGKNRDVNLRNYRAKLVIWSVVDEDGKRLFTDADAEWLGDKSAAALSRIVDVASRLSGISEQDVEELTGELGNGQPAALPSV
jgi:hypothetical protein